MTATETVYPELTADLVEQVCNLPAEGLEALRRLVERQTDEIANSRRQMWHKIQLDLAAYDRGEMKAYTFEEMTERIRSKIAVMKSGAAS